MNQEERCSETYFLLLEQITTLKLLKNYCDLSSMHTILTPEGEVFLGVGDTASSHQEVQNKTISLASGSRGTGDYPTHTAPKKRTFLNVIGWMFAKTSA